MKLSDEVQFVLSLCVLVVAAACGGSLLIHVYGLHWAHVDLQEAAHTYRQIQIKQPCDEAEAQQADEAK